MTRNSPGASDREVDVAFFLPSLGGGGAERLFIRLAGAFADSGMCVDIVVSNGKGELLGSIPERARLIDFGLRFNSQSILKLRRYLAREKPRTVLSGLSMNNVIVTIASRGQKNPPRVVLSEHNHFTSYLRASGQKVRKTILPPLMRWTYKHADAIVAVSARVAADLSKYINVHPNTIHVIQNPAIDPELLRMSYESADHPWFHDDDVPVILAVGRLTDQKDFINLLDAFHIVVKKINARLVILGEGELRSTLENRIRDLGIEDKVSLPGFTQNPYALMRRTDLFVLSSQREGLPIVLIEALACGARVVSTDCPSGPAEILENGRFGSLVPVGDAVALAGALTASLRAPTSEDHSRTFIEGYSIDKGVQEYKNVLFCDS